MPRPDSKNVFQNSICGCVLVASVYAISLGYRFMQQGGRAGPHLTAAVLELPNETNLSREEVIPS